MAFTTLVNTETLERLCGTAEVAVVDCRFKLDDPGWAARAFLDGHVPGAVFADLERDLSGAKTGNNGRHPLPDPLTLSHTLGALGISNTTQVIAYDQDAGMYASRLWWLLRWMGHSSVAVLDGGFAKWVSEARPVSSIREEPAHVSFSGTPQPGMIVSADDVGRLIHNPEWRLIDARAPERYRGEIEPIDRVPGHIPTATNHFFGSNVDAANTFLPADALKKKLIDSMAGVRSDHVVCYCGSGVTACQNVLAMEHVGLPGAKLYPGSWSEWASDERRPIARGDR
jgi:thiosulfate/3-mercaptopyruvate sulfurtransferase